jgi:plasmid stability protein
VVRQAVGFAPHRPRPILPPSPDTPPSQPISAHGEWVDMRFGWNYADRMSSMVQIRNVPSDLHRQLKARAALEGMSLSDYLLREVRRAVERPTLDEMKQRLAGRVAVRPRPSPAAAVRAAREGR